jgi:hypothetical protein
MSRPFSPTWTSLRTVAPPSYVAARFGSNPISPGKRPAPRFTSATISS